MRRAGRLIGLLALGALLVIDLWHGDGLNITVVVVGAAAWIIAGGHAERHPTASAALLVPLSVLATVLAATETRTVIFSGTEVAALLCCSAAALRWYRSPLNAVVALACSAAAVATPLRSGSDQATTAGVIAAVAVLAAVMALARRAAAQPKAAPVPEPEAWSDPTAIGSQLAPVFVPSKVRASAGDNPFAAIRSLANELGHSGVKVLIELDPPSPPAIDWTPRLSAAVVDIVQEALTNVRLHASGATTVQLHFHIGEDHLDLKVLDDGQAGPPRRPGGGLLAMQRQAAKVAGKVRAGPSPTGGWEVRAVLPALRKVAPTQAG